MTMLKIREVEIVKGWYFSVGKRFEWIDDGYEMWGVGLDRALFNSNMIIVTVDGRKYTVDTKEARDFIRKYNSHEELQGAKIGYISKSIMKEQDATSE